MDVEFLDAGRLPTIVAPMTKVTKPGRVHAHRSLHHELTSRLRSVEHRGGGPGRNDRPIWQPGGLRGRAAAGSSNPALTRRLYGGGHAAQICGKIWLITGAGLVARLALLAVPAALARRGIQPPWRCSVPGLDARRGPQRQRTALFYLSSGLFAVVSTNPAVLRLFPVLLGTAAIPLLAALGTAASPLTPAGSGRQ